MRDIGATLTAQQKAMGDAKLRIALTKSGSTPYTYYIDSGTDRILSCKHIEQEWSQTATVTIQDSSHTIADLDLRGYKGVISYGYGANYSACAPLWVTAQRTDATGGSVTTTLELEGTFNLMAQDKALSAFTPDDLHVTKIGTMLTYAVQATTGWKYDHCTPYTLTFDTGYDGGENTISTFAPKDHFQINFNESRLSVIKKLLAWTDNKLRVEGDGAVHILLPVTSGSTYDYEYNDADTYHNFFGQATCKRIVMPQKVIVSSHPDYEDSYTGYAEDTANSGGLTQMVESHYLRVTSNAECTAIATSILSQHQVDASGGSGFCPMNCGQEVFDYVAITDSKTGDTKTGNIGYIVREYSQGKFTMGFSFGKMPVGGLFGSSSWVSGELTVEALREAFDELRGDLNQLQGFVGDVVDYLVARKEVVPKWHIEKQAIMPVWIPGAPVVTTEAVSDIASTTATGNGTIDDMGVPDATQHGVCYNKTGSPTINDDKTTEGVPTGSGAFTSAVTELDADTLYYVRAYATNATGTGYGVQVTFTTEAA